MATDVRRRDILLAALCSVAACPASAYAEQAKTPTIGLVGGATAANQATWTAAFVNRLGQLGWIEGKNVAIEYRWAEGRFERSPELFKELVGRKVDVIVTHATANVLAAKRATPIIPIVFASAGDPIGDGLVDSLRKPGGNVTGLSTHGVELAGKAVEMLRNLLPTATRLGVLSHVGNPVTMIQRDTFQKVAKQQGIEAVIEDIRRPDDIAPAIEKFKGQVAGLFVTSDPLFNTHRALITSLTVKARLPSTFLDRMYVEAGGLMSCGTKWPAMWARTTDLTDKVLRGTKPAEIPVEMPFLFEMVINLKVAKELGLTLPRIMLARADEVIE